MTYRTMTALCMPLALAACGGSNAAGPTIRAVATQATLETPNAAGDFATTLNNVAGREVIDSNGNGYAYQIGEIPGSTDVLAQAGIVSGTSVTPAPSIGSAQLDGIYQVRTLTDLESEDGNVVGYERFQTSLITLIADFDSGTLTGDAANLEVAGRFTDGLLSGDVTFDGQSATLTGIVGADQAVGAFYGRDDDSVIAGGFNVSD